MKPFAMLFAAVLMAIFFASVHASSNIHNDEELAFFALLLQHQAQQKKKEEKAAGRAAFFALADAILSYARPSTVSRPSYSKPKTTSSSSRPKTTSRPSYRPRPTSSKPKTTTTSKRPVTSSTKRPTNKGQAPKPAVQKKQAPSTKKQVTPSKKQTPSTKKQTTTKKPVVPTKKQTTTKKPVEKKPVTKKPVEKKPTTKKPVEKQPTTPKKSVEKKPVAPKPTTATPSKPVKNSAAAQADKIIGYEGRFDKNGNLKVYKLPAGDGGGKYEVAGINDRYHPKVAAELKGMVERGEYQKARDAAAKYLASYTDPSASKSKIPAISFYLRDSSFNRGPGGANTILKHALGLGKGASSTDTSAALRKAEQNPQQLLHKLRESREWYERNYAKRSESSPFWKGLVNRWNKAEQDAKSFGFTPSE